MVVPFQSGVQLYCVKLSGLEENTPYKVFILAANSAGKSEPVTLKFRTAISGEYASMLMVAAAVL